MLRIPKQTPANIAEAAVAYAKAGFYVGPTKKTDRKNPGSIFGKSWQERTSRDPDYIRSWFINDHPGNGKEGRGLFIHCGRSGAFVVDIDEPEKVPFRIKRLLRRAPYWTTSVSGERRHYLFAMPEGRNLSNSTAGLKGMGFDVRGANGVIVVYPTLHPEDGPDAKPPKNPRDPGRYGIGRPGAAQPLPRVFIEGMRDADPVVEKVDYNDIMGFLEKHDGNELPRSLRGPLTYFINNVHSHTDPDARHNAMVRSAAWAMKEARAGAYPAMSAAEELFTLWEGAFLMIEGRRISPTKDEFEGILRWAISKALTSDRAVERSRLGLNEEAA